MIYIILTRIRIFSVLKLEGFLDVLSFVFYFINEEIRNCDILLCYIMVIRLDRRVLDFFFSGLFVI